MLFVGPNVLISDSGDGIISHLICRQRVHSEFIEGGFSSSLRHKSGTRNDDSTAQNSVIGTHVVEFFIKIRDYLAVIRKLRVYLLNDFRGASSAIHETDGEGWFFPGFKVFNEYISSDPRPVRFQNVSICRLCRCSQSTSLSDAGIQFPQLQLSDAQASIETPQLNPKLFARNFGITLHLLELRFHRAKLPTINYECCNADDAKSYLTPKGSMGDPMDILSKVRSGLIGTVGILLAICCHCALLYCERCLVGCSGRLLAPSSFGIGNNSFWSLRNRMRHHEHEYHEGPKALERCEQGMSKLLRLPSNP